MTSILEIAKYITSKKAPITTMKLQKLCYYAQAWSLAWDGQPLFNEDFEAWANGPVSPVLFDAHRGLYVVNDNFPASASIPDLTKSEKETIEIILNDYGDKEPQWLSDLSHKELPWRDARGNTPPGQRCSTVISKDSMEQYYGGL